LSATALPLEHAARWLVGPGRRCAIAHSGESSPPCLKVEPLPEGEAFLKALVDRLVMEILSARKTVLVFTNTRALAERLGWAVRRRFAEWDKLVGVHHSALSAGRRRTWRSASKGQLRLVVSSTSLELGIDIGPIDLVVLVHPPGDVIRLLQRVGRAGHGPGGLRQGLVLTSSAAELLEAAVTTASG